MDEPLSNLDAKLRVQMRTEVARLQNELGTTTVYVTHDQTEAMTLGDRVAVMRAGVLQQVGSPADLYDEPEEPLRRRLHRLAGDELHAGDDRGRAVTLPFGEVDLPPEVARSSARLRPGDRGPAARELRGRLARRRREGPAAPLSTRRSPWSSRWARRSTPTSRSRARRSSPRSSRSWRATPAVRGAGRRRGQVVARLDAASEAERGKRSSSGSTRPSSTSSTRTRARAWH